MITATESTNSFRGVYYHKDTNFTKNQRKRYMPQKIKQIIPIEPINNCSPEDNGP